MEASSEQRVASSDVAEGNRLATRYSLFALTILVAATRFLAASHSMWDWDEALFASALRHYNVALHHPHPPGFPLFIGMARLARLFVHDDFRALRGVSLAASAFVFPALYALARAFRFPQRTSSLAALLFSFIPNVWYWGGTALSDVFAIVLFLGGAALMLRDDDSRWSYLLGSALFAGTLLVRPQNVLLAYPWFLAAWRRMRARRFGMVVASAALITVLVLGGYAIAAKVTGWSAYIASTREHQKYVATVDGALNPNRPPVWKIFYSFAIDPFDANTPSKAMFIFMLIAFLRPRRRLVDVVATFLPNFLLAWFMLSITGVSRLSLGYIPMHAILAAEGMDAVADLLTRRASAQRRARYAAVLQCVFAAAIILRYIDWIWPGLKEVRTHDAPTAAAPKWLLQHVPRATGKLYVQGGMTPFVAYYLEGYKVVDTPDNIDPTALPPAPDAWYTADGLDHSGGSINFRRNQKRLWALSHRRYFVTCVVPAGGFPKFVEGWYTAEEDESSSWRWMARRSRTLLQTFRGDGALELRLYAPIDAEPPPTVTVSMNGAVLQRFAQRTPSTEVKFRTPSRVDAPNELVIDVDEVINQARAHGRGDPRDLGLRLDALSWRPVR